MPNSKSTERISMRISCNQKDYISSLASAKRVSVANIISDCITKDMNNSLELAGIASDLSEIKSLAQDNADKIDSLQESMKLLIEALQAR